MKKLLMIGVAAMIAAVTLADGEWSSRLPLQDAFVRDIQPNANFGTDEGLIAGNNRESCMLFDVSGLANVTAARIRFYVTQCGTTEGAKWPLFFRIMRNDRWDESTVTWNSLPDEFRVREPILATNDVTLAGYLEVPAGSQNTWQTVDVTEAVKAAAPRGRLSLHVYTSWDGGSGDSMPLCFSSVNCTTEAQRPVLEFQGEEGGMRLIEDTFIERTNPNSNFGVAASEATRSGAIVVEKNAREGFMKFDLSGISSASVNSAKLRVSTNGQAETGNTVQFQIIGDNWSESTVTWNNPPPGVTPGAAWAETTPKNAIRVPSPGANVYCDFELAPLVNQALAAGKTTMSLHITIQNASPRFFICYSKDHETAAWHPYLALEPFHDAPLMTRTPLQETFVGSNVSGRDTAYFRALSWNYLQVGCDGNMAQYGLMLFDPTGLENADYVRFRVLAAYPRDNAKLFGGEGALRVTAWTTDVWSATNLTWNTLAPWFPKIASVVEGTPLDGEVASIYLAQHKGTAPYMEVDVTDAVRAAAQAGKMVTFGLFSNQAWPCFFKGESGNPAVLIFPDPDVTFGSYVHASLDRSGETPALKLTWAPGAAAGAVYTVERMEKGEWMTVAAGLSDATCLDADAKPYETHTYRVTEAATGASVTKSFDFAPEVKVLACADTFVYSGNKGATNGTAISVVHKYEQNTGGIREEFYRFDLSEVPENFKTATLKFYTTGPDEYYSGNELFWVLTYPDFEWTDDNAPSWNNVFDNEWSTPQARGNHPDSKRPAEGQVNTVGNVTSRLLGGEVFEYDVASIISVAKTNGDSHITFHTCAYDPDVQWNFGIISRERAQGVSQAAQIVFTLKNWVKHGTKIVIR